MVGILTRKSSGLIFAENFNLYPNGWTFERSGSASALAKGLQEGTSHSGGGDFLIDTGYDWPASAYARLTKTADMSSAGNRITKLFRGAGLVASVYDHFYGTTFDTTKWRDETNGSSPPTVANSLCHIPNGGQIRGQWINPNNMRWRTPVKVLIRAQIPAPQSGQHFNCTIDGIQTSDGNKIQIDFGGTTSGRAIVEFSRYDSHQQVDIGPLSDFEGAMHVYGFEWTSSVAKVYVDGTLKATADGSHVTVDEEGYYYQPKIRLGLYQGYSPVIDVDYVAHTLNTDLFKFSFKIGAQTVFDQDVETEGASLDNGYFEKGWTALTVSGSQTLELKFRNAVGSTTKKLAAQILLDDLIIMLGTILTITGLLTSQKVELYDSGGVLKNTVTKAVGVDPSIDVSGYIKSGDGWQGYFKVYDTDGSTLLYTSATDAIWGGDTWAWASQVSVLYAPAQSLRIYKSTAPATPKSIAAIFTLKWRDDDNPISGKTVTFSTSLGSVSPSSAVTDSNGQVSVTLTSGSVHGWAVIKADWVGDGDVAPAKAFLEIAVYDDQDVGDSSKPYQLFVHGLEYVFNGGNYSRSIHLESRQFEIELPEIAAAIDGSLEIIIYRRGVKDYVGRITKLNLTAENRMILKGWSNHWKLGRRNTRVKAYNVEPRTILLDLLARFPSGVAPGNIGTFGNAIPIDFAYDTLTQAIQRLLDLMGWYAKLNLDDTLDLAQNFGTVRDITFETGATNVNVERELDFEGIVTRAFLIGEPSTLVSDKDDLTQEGIYGLIEQAFLDKNLTTSSSLNVENQAILDGRKVPIQRTRCAAIDLALAPDAYDVGDYVTIIDNRTGLSDSLRIISVTRDLKDEGYVDFELGASQRTLVGAIAGLNRNVKDLGTA